MGGGSYSIHDTRMRAVSNNYATKSVREVFKERKINNAMDPHGVQLRESCDSDEHPDSFAVVLALDETGSMGSTPKFFINEGFVNMMEKIIQKGINDPQILFLGIGDHESDESPLQVSQFESNDELLEHWLKTVFLEGRGGNNDGESYHLAWYFAGMHTSIDCHAKRGKKGVLITVGDEKVLPNLPESALKKIMGSTGYQHQSWTAEELLEKAQEKYEVHHIVVAETARGSERHMREAWKQLIGDEFLHIASRHEDVADIAADIVIASYTSQAPGQQKTESKIHLRDEPVTIDKDEDDEEIL